MTRSFVRGPQFGRETDVHRECTWRDQKQLLMQPAPVNKIISHMLPRLIVKHSLEGYNPKAKVRNARGVAPLGIQVLRTCTSLLENSSRELSGQSETRGLLHSKGRDWCINAKHNTSYITRQKGVQTCQREFKLVSQIRSTTQDVWCCLNWGLLQSVHSCCSPVSSFWLCRCLNLIHAGLSANFSALHMINPTPSQQTNTRRADVTSFPPHKMKIWVRHHCTVDDEWEYWSIRRGYIRGNHQALHSTAGDKSP